MKTKIFLLGIVAACIFLQPSGLSAQYFQKVYTIDQYDRTSRDIMRTQSGEYLIVGSSNNSNPADADLYVMRTNGNGDKLWDTIYGGARPDYAYHMTESFDGNYIVVGYSQSFGPGDYDIYMLKIDPTGKMLKQRSVDFGGKNEEARQIVRTHDNKFLVIGTTGIGSSSVKPDFVVLKIGDDLEDVEPAKTFGGSEAEYGLAIARTDDGYLLAGLTRSKGAGGNDAYVIKVDNNLSQIWDKTYGDVLDEEIVGLVANSDGTAMLAIRDSVPGPALDGNIEVMLQKIDASTAGAGAEVGSAKVYGGDSKDTPKTIMPVSTGGYIVGAISRSWWQDTPQAWLIRTDANGDDLWIRDYGLIHEHDHCHMIKESHDGGFVMVGHQRQGAVMKIIFFKLDDSGAVGIDEAELELKGFALYPNPSTNSQVNMRISAEGTYQVQVLSLMGQEMYQGQVQLDGSGDVQLDLQQLNAGIYIVNVKGEKGSGSQKLILE